MIDKPSDRIKLLRKLLKLNQVEFSNSISISQSALSQIEQGLTNISLSTLIKLSRVHGINCNWIVLGEGEIFMPHEKVNAEKIPPEVLKKITKGTELKVKDQEAINKILLLEKENEALRKIIKMSESSQN